MGNLTLGLIAAVVVIAVIPAMLAASFGSGIAYAGGEEETLKPAEEKSDSDKIEPKFIWGLVGFLLALFLTAL